MPGSGKVFVLAMTRARIYGLAARRLAHCNGTVAPLGARPDARLHKRAAMHVSATLLTADALFAPPKAACCDAGGIRVRV